MTKLDSQSQSLSYRAAYALLALWSCLVMSKQGVGEDAIDFGRDIAPLLAEHCVRCHHPGNKQGEVSLATVDDLVVNDYVIAGDPDASHLIDLVVARDGEAEMPQEGPRLSDQEVQLLRRWVQQGANWPHDVIVKQRSKADSTWWSLQPIDRSRRQSTIDDFITEKLAEKRLQLNSPADRRALIRRASYDLHGLPPSPEEIEAFVNDSDPNAYAALIDRLLASPRYGERWGRHWLDVVRFGESVGFEQNFIVEELWPFRDYVIRSINEDKPFDQFIREHIAGDVLATGTPTLR